MGLLDIFKKSNTDYSTVDNEGLRAISSRFRNSKEDTVFITTSRICPTCSMYNRRIFSLWGRYKAFPVLPIFLHNATCPTCNKHIGYSHYFPGINGNLKKDIIYSNRPFKDTRTAKEKSLWDQHIQEEQFISKVNQDYSWICSHLPDIAPKSIGGYKRMISSNSANYQKIVSAAKNEGYII